MVTEEATQIIDGALLSDLSLYHYHHQIRASMAQSGRNHIDWVTIVAQSFIKLGVIAHCKIYDDIKKYPNGYCQLWTRGHPLTSALYERWYPSGKKAIPTDLILTPVSLANWFLGDGSSTQYGNSVTVKLSTQGFNIEDMNKLLTLLCDMGVHGFHMNKCGNYHALYMGRKEDVLKFINTIKPFIPNSFGYKLKNPGNYKMQ